MLPHPVIPLVLAQQESSSGFWITVLVVVAILALFIGLIVYVAIRSRKEGKHPQQPDGEY